MKKLLRKNLSFLVVQKAKLKIIKKTLYLSFRDKNLDLKKCEGVFGCYSVCR